jgi:phage gp36-like protein
MASVTVYATLADLEQCGLPPQALASIQPTVKQAALVKASAYADTFIGDAVTLPLQAPVDPTITDAVCQIAAWRLLCLRGFNPDNPGDAVVRQGYLDARDWLTRVANKQAKLNVVQGSPPSVQPDISSACPRGFGDVYSVSPAANDPAIITGG